MEKNKNSYFVIIILFFFFFLFFSNTSANENKEFLTLKNVEVNLRHGPSFKYPIKLIYKKKHQAYDKLTSIRTSKVTSC